MEEEKIEETQVVNEKQEDSVSKETDTSERVPEAEAEVKAELKQEETCEEEGESKFNEVCEELGIPEVKKEAGEELPVVVPVSDDGKGKGTMVNVSRDTHNRLKVEKAKGNLKSFDALIRQAFGW